MTYVIAAYGIVILTLAGYGLRIEAQRRRLERSARVEQSARPGR